MDRFFRGRTVKILENYLERAYRVGFRRFPRQDYAVWPDLSDDVQTDWVLRSDQAQVFSVVALKHETRLFFSVSRFRTASKSWRANVMSCIYNNDHAHTGSGGGRRPNRSDRKRDALYRTIAPRILCRAVCGNRRSDRNHTVVPTRTTTTEVVRANDNFFCRNHRSTRFDDDVRKKWRESRRENAIHAKGVREFSKINIARKQDATRRCFVRMTSSGFSTRKKQTNSKTIRNPMSLR